MGKMEYSFFKKINCEAERVPKKLDPRRNTQRYIIIKLLKIKDKERILKAAKGESYLLRSSHDY